MGGRKFPITDFIHSTEAEAEAIPLLLLLFRKFLRRKRSDVETQREKKRRGERSINRLGKEKFSGTFSFHLPKSPIDFERFQKKTFQVTQRALEVSLHSQFFDVQKVPFFPEKHIKTQEGNSKMLIQKKKREKHSVRF